MSSRMPENMSDRMPDRMPDRMSDRMPNRLPERMPDRMSEYMPDTMSEYMLDKLSEYKEYVSKYTSWNVMVGITRSKAWIFPNCQRLFCVGLVSFGNRLLGVIVQFHHGNNATSRYSYPMSFCKRIETCVVKNRRIVNHPPNHHF